MYTDADVQGTPETCVFPFYDAGIRYDNCARPDEYPDLGWCSFNSTYDGHWGYCTDDCKSKKLAKPYGGTCQATAIDCPPVAYGTTRLGFGSDGTCVFPFKFRGEWNYKCKDSKVYAGVGWCSFDSDFGSGSMKTGRWGYCTSECPKEYDDPCEGVVCKIPGETCVNGQCKCGEACSCENNYEVDLKAQRQNAYLHCDPTNSKCKCSETEDSCKDGKFCDAIARKCMTCNGGDSCCTEDNKCDAGEGDCDSDEDCKEGLRCGTDNCGIAVAYGDLGKGKGICELGFNFAAHRDQETGIVGSGILSSGNSIQEGWIYGLHRDNGEYGCGSWRPNDDCCYDPSLTKEDEALNLG